MLSLLTKAGIALVAWGALAAARAANIGYSGRLTDGSGKPRSGGGNLEDRVGGEPLGPRPLTPPDVRIRIRRFAIPA
jgi:hypothetical protein